MGSGRSSGREVSSSCSRSYHDDPMLTDARENVNNVGLPTFGAHKD
jgi:hypothetical protein